MFFDDRLTTVLRQESASPAAKRTQFRQLLDILGNRKFGPEGRHDPSLVAAAWLRMDALGEAIPARDRAAMIREPSWRFRSPELTAHLADFEPEVASAALNRAELSGEDWAVLIPRLPLRARGFLRLRRDLPVEANAVLERLGVHDRGLPLPSVSSDAELVQDNEADGEETPNPYAPDNQPLNLAPETIVERDETPELSPAPSSEPSPTAQPPAKPAKIDPIEAGRSEISALVERIALYRKTRELLDPEDLTDSERSPRLPLDEGQSADARRVQSFGFSADAGGRIDWAEAEAAPMVIGKKLAQASDLSRAFGDRGYGQTDEALITRAFLQRQPIEDAHTELVGAPAIAGEWRLDAQPRFTIEGQFTGYVGRYRRMKEDEDDALDSAGQEADRIRQLLHELRTPVTAIQGYAEVIQQQLFGPAPHEYRALAAAIAADAAFILAGFEELDRLARLEVGALSLDPGESDVAMIVRRTERQLAQALSGRGAGFSVAFDEHADCTVPIDTEDAERLIWRMMATLAGACEAGETLQGSAEADGEDVRFVCELPRSLRAQEDLFASTAKPLEGAINAGVFGAGFALRLARAEARASGGGLHNQGDRIALSLPRLERASGEPEHGEPERGEPLNPRQAQDAPILTRT